MGISTFTNELSNILGAGTTFKVIMQLFLRNRFLQKENKDGRRNGKIQECRFKKMVSELAVQLVNEVR